MAQNPNPETDSKNPDGIVKKVKDCLYQAWEHDKDNRIDAASDLNFLAGNQWPEQVRQQREQEGRPMLTINRLPQFVRQVTNDVRQADVSIQCIPTDGAIARAQGVRSVKAEMQQEQMAGMGHNGGPQMPPAEKKLTMAEVFNGLLREIQYQSSATHVYATAAEHQVSCGIGWFRIVTEYDDDMSFNQCIRVREIKQPMSVYPDPAATEIDRSDAQWIIVTECIPRESFKARYPDASEVSVEDYDVKESELYWSSSDEIRIAEYWCKKPVKKRIAQAADGSAVEIPDGAEVPEGVPTRTVDTHEVWQYVMNGSQLLEEPRRWPTKHIPIVPVIGSEIPLERKTYRYGLIRFARDPQQLYNYARTSAAESMGLAPKVPWLVTPAMIKPFKHLWDSANKRLQPYLPYMPDPQAPGAMPKREAPPDVPMAYVQEAGVADSDIKATVGIYDPQLGQRSSENSGRAIIAREKQGDTGTFHYPDNLRRALEYAGRILVDLIPVIYDAERTVRILGEDGAEMYVTLNQAGYDERGEPGYVNDVSRGKYDVRVKIGPSYATKRMESADAMMQFMQAYPPSAQFIGDLVAENMDWPGSRGIAERLRRAVPPQILGEDAPPQPPDPAQEMQMQVAQLQMQEMQLKLEKMQAETAKILAEIEKTKVQTDAIDDELDIKEAQMMADMERWQVDQYQRDRDRDDTAYERESDREMRFEEMRMRNQPSANGALRPSGESNI